MAKDYEKLCPKLSKHIDKSTVDADFAPKVETEEVKPKLVKAKVETVYAMLKLDPQYLKIANEVGLTVEQVEELHKELLAYVAPGIVE